MTNLIVAYCRVSTELQGSDGLGMAAQRAAVVTYAERTNSTIVAAFEDVETGRRDSLEKPGRNVAAKSGLNRSLLDAGLGMLATVIGERSAYAVRRVINVDARWSSQTCAECRHVASESRRGERFACVRCGHEADADVNAARVILMRAESPPTRA